MLSLQDLALLGFAEFHRGRGRARWGVAPRLGSAAAGCAGAMLLSFGGVRGRATSSLLAVPDARRAAGKRPANISGTRTWCPLDHVARRG